MTMVLTGLDIEAKAKADRGHLLWDLLGGKERFAAVDVQLVRTDRADAPTNEQATAQLRVTVKDPDPGLAGRTFSTAVTWSWPSPATPASSPSPRRGTVARSASTGRRSCRLPPSGRSCICRTGTRSPFRP